MTRLFGLLILVFVFVGMPLYTLNTLLLPDLNKLENVYANAGNIANQAAGVCQQTSAAYLQITATDNSSHC